MTAHGYCAWCGATVDVVQKGWRDGDLYYCTRHHVIATRDPRDVGEAAALDAIDLLAKPASTLVRWPWRALNELAGPFVQGRLTYLAAFPGGGKTTVISHLVQYWLAQGLKVSLLPLESDPLEVMARLGCLTLGISADEALSMKLRIRADGGDRDARYQLGLLTEWMYARARDVDFLQQLRIEPLNTLTPFSFRKAIEAAHVMESDIVLVDHVDHTENDAGDNSPAIRLSDALQSDALRMAKDYGMPFVLATQLNSSRTGGDQLAHYRPPVSDWLFNKGKKEMVAATIIGTYRPLDPNVTTEQRRNVTERRAEAHTLGKKQRMGFNAMKLRYGGASLGMTRELQYVNGRLSDLADVDRRDMERGAHGLFLAS